MRCAMRCRSLDDDDTTRLGLAALITFDAAITAWTKPTGSWPEARLFRWPTMRATPTPARCSPSRPPGMATRANDRTSSPVARAGIQG